MNGSKKGQKKHDDSVRRSVDWYKSRGYAVRADIPGEKRLQAVWVGIGRILLLKREEMRLLLRLKQDNLQALIRNNTRRSKNMPIRK